VVILGVPPLGQARLSARLPDAGRPDHHLDSGARLADPAPAVLASRQVRRGASRLRLTLISADADESVILALIEQLTDPAARAAGLGLTLRETEVLTLAAEGRTNREIADSLGISPLTVRTHLEHAYPKLGVANRTAAAARLR
jgi:DNA-binding CsgD family transcriptional regulator